MPKTEEEPIIIPENGETIPYDSVGNELAQQAFSRILIDEQDIVREDFNVFRSAD